MELLKWIRHFHSIIFLTILFGLTSIVSKARKKATTEITKVYDDLLNPRLSVSEADKQFPKLPKHIQLRLSTACKDTKCEHCLESCRHLMNLEMAKNQLIQYTLLKLCSMGCKEELECIKKFYCLPVLKENPDHFIKCSNKCDLLHLVPKIFKTGKKSSTKH